ncbi:MAG: 2Fe-2S iron-sulfur cluster-binding protein [Ginsengibacter sp.]
MKFNFLQKSLDPITIENVKDDQSILDVALDNDIEIHTDCGGVCACSTCHCYIEEGKEYLPEISDREEDFISMAMNPKDNSRLSCQCILAEGHGEIEVTIPDQTQNFDD